jgi:hypothetical protein
MGSGELLTTGQLVILLTLKSMQLFDQHRGSYSGVVRGPCHSCVSVRRHRHHLATISQRTHTHTRVESWREGKRGASELERVHHGGYSFFEDQTAAEAIVYWEKIRVICGTFHSNAMGFHDGDEL